MATTETGRAPQTTDPKVRGPFTRGFVALGLAVLGAIFVPVGFITGIDAALNGASNGASVSVAVFFVGLALAAIALILAIVGLVRRGSKVANALALIVALLPAAFILTLRIAATA